MHHLTTTIRIPKFIRIELPHTYLIAEESGDGCWNCSNKAKDKDGYPRVSYYNKDMHAHRLIYLLLKGAIPKGYKVRHTCDNPKCINPEHLISGTHKDNMQDKVKRGSQPRGEYHPSSKLKEYQVEAILRDSKSSVKQLAEKFLVSEGTIRSIKKCKTWEHIYMKIFPNIFNINLTRTIRNAA